MRLSPDQLVFWQYGIFKLNATIVFTWGVMLVLVVGSMLITRRLSTGLRRSRWQNLLEIVVSGIVKQIEEVGLSEPQKYLGFLGTLFLFVAVASLGTILPGYEPPTGSLSTTTAARTMRARRSARCSALKSKGWASTLHRTSNQRSLCCRLTLSAKFPAHWPWPSACSAT